MKRFTTMVCLLLITVPFVVFSVPALASAPMAVSGTLENPVYEPLEAWQAGGNMIIRQIEYADIHGTIEGSYTLEMMAVIHSDGRLNVHGIATIDPCDVDGKSGTIVMRLTGTGVVPSIQGKWVILSGTGELANVHGQGTFEVTEGVGGTYSGRIHFDPN